MKKVILFFCIVTGLIEADYLRGQNLVPNPSFEEYIICPPAAAEIYLAKGWNNYGYSPDYFNICATTPSVSIPFNIGGFQFPASGNAYCGICTYVNPIVTGIGLQPFREYIASKFSVNLEIGVKYYVSYKVSLGYKKPPPDYANCSTNNLGVKFTNIPFITYKPRIDNISQVNEISIISDTTNWTRISGAFIADSSYQYIVLGNFYDNIHTDTIIIDGSDICYAAYYYIDDVCVSTDSLYSANYSWTGINELHNISEISIYPNPASNYLNIDFPLLKGKYDIEIINELGKCILKQKINNQHTILDMTNIANGLIVIKINYNNHTLFYKLLKI